MLEGLLRGKVFMPVYKIHFTWKEKPRIIKSRELDMTHPYFVSLTDLIFPEASAVIIDPNDDELRREFGDARSIMIPFQNVQLIETLEDDSDGTTGKVIQFTKGESESHE